MHHSNFQLFFFVRFLFRENHTKGGGKLRLIREISLQTNKQTNNTSEKRTKERRENKTENHGTQNGLLSLFFFAFGAFLFEGIVVVWWKKEEEEQKKHQSSSVDKDFSGFIIRAFKQH